MLKLQYDRLWDMVKALLVLQGAIGTVSLRNFGKDIRHILRSRFLKQIAAQNIHRQCTGFRFVTKYAQGCIDSCEKITNTSKMLDNKVALCIQYINSHSRSLFSCISLALYSSHLKYLLFVSSPSCWNMLAGLKSNTCSLSAAVQQACSKKRLAYIWLLFFFLKLNCAKSTEDSGIWL